MQLIRGALEEVGHELNRSELPTDGSGNSNSMSSGEAQPANLSSAVTYHQLYSTMSMHALRLRQISSLVQSLEHDVSQVERVALGGGGVGVPWPNLGIKGTPEQQSIAPSESRC